MEAPTNPPIMNAMIMRRMMVVNEPSVKAGCEMMIVQSRCKVITIPFLLIEERGAEIKGSRSESYTLQ